MGVDEGKESVDGGNEASGLNEFELHFFFVLNSQRSRIMKKEKHLSDRDLPSGKESEENLMVH